MRLVGQLQPAGHEDRKREQHHRNQDTKDEKFVSLGDGTVDFPGWLTAIEGKGNFYLTYERDEFLPTALESATNSRIYLRTLGL